MIYIRVKWITMKPTKASTVKIPNKDLFDNPFINFKEWGNDKNYAYDDLDTSVGKAGYHSESFVPDNEDYSKW